MLRPEPLTLDSDSRALYDRLVPPDHPLRQFDDCLDFSFVLPLVAERYHDEIGRPAEHPEQMYRLLFAQFYLNLSDDKACLAAHESLAETSVSPSTLKCGSMSAPPRRSHRGGWPPVSIKEMNMPSKDRPAREQKKPKKDAKAKVVSREEPVPMTVEVVKRKRKERLPDED